MALSPWVYEVVASAGAATLSVEAVFPPGTSSLLSVASGAEAFIENVAVRHEESWRAVPPTGTNWDVPQCERGCTVRYTFALQRAAGSGRHGGVASSFGSAAEARPSAWLLRPIDAPPETTFRFHVTSAPGEGFLSGLPQLRGAPGTYEAHARSAFDLPFAVFGVMGHEVIEDGDVHLALLSTFRGAARKLLPWAEASARIVRAYYGRTPTPGLLVGVIPESGDEVGFGTTTGVEGASILVSVGRDVSPEALARDWVLVHEMIHTALPYMGEGHHWLEEGIATYVEPLARARAGNRTADDVWREWMRDMPKGEPEPGDLGLDRTPTWGRTYWGGALFCLAADVEIRKRTHNDRSLDDALRGVLQAGGTLREAWPMDRFLAVGDAATHTTVLSELYARHSAHAERIDLDQLWRALGVREGEGTAVEFDDRAPLALIRRSMTERRLP